MKPSRRRENRLSGSTVRKIAARVELMKARARALRNGKGVPLPVVGGDE